MSDGPTVVVVEDDRAIADLVRLYLEAAGFVVHHAVEAESGLRLVDAHEPSLVVVDIGLPGPTDGFDLCRRIRSRGTAAILVLTARDGEVDRVLGLELGADDYVTKPFSPRELVARVRAILRRTGESVPARPPVVQLGTVEVDPGRREVRVEGEVVPLTGREFALLLHLVEQRGLALTRRQLLDGAWGPDWYGDERTVDVHVRQLRKKLGPDLPLVTVWGIGYRLG